MEVYLSVRLRDAHPLKVEGRFLPIDHVGVDIIVRVRLLVEFIVRYMSPVDFADRET